MSSVDKSSNSLDVHYYLVVLVKQCWNNQLGQISFRYDLCGMSHRFIVADKTVIA